MLCAARCWSVLIVLVALMLSACAQAKPASPDPQSVLAILRAYPGGTLSEDRIMKEGLDVSYRVSHIVRTTTETAVAYYDAPLRRLGLEESPYRGLTSDDLRVDYTWYYYGCPFHSLTMSTTAERLTLTYTYGPCR
jgi:hypothetical protein